MTAFQPGAFQSDAFQQLGGGVGAVVVPPPPAPTVAAPTSGGRRHREAGRDLDDMILVAVAIIATGSLEGAEWEA